MAAPQQRRIDAAAAEQERLVAVAEEQRIAVAAEQERLAAAAAKVNFYTTDLLTFLVSVLLKH